MVLNKYQIEDLDSIQKRGYSKTAIVYDENSEKYFAKWILGIDKKSKPSKLLLDKLRFLRKAEHESLVKIVEYGWDNDENSYCIIYKYLNAKTLEELVYDLKPTEFLKGLVDLVDCLSTLQMKYRISHGDITPANVLIDEKMNFFLVDFSIAETTSSLSLDSSLHIFARDFAAPEKWRADIAKGFPYQSDVYSLGKLASWYFEAKGQNLLEEINSLIGSMTVDQPASRLKFSVIKDNLLKILALATYENENVVEVEFGRNVYEHNSIIDSLNNTKFQLKLDVSPKQNSGKVLLDIITSHYYIHALWIIDETKLVVLSTEDKDSEKYRNKLKYCTEFGLPLNFVDNIYGASFDLTPYLKRIISSKQKNRSFRKDKESRDKELSFFKELLKKELEVLEKNSIRLKYLSFKRKDDNEIEFQIDINDQNKFSKTGQILTHIEKALPPNPEEFEYILSASGNKKDLKGQNKISGVAYEWDSKNRILKIKDCESLDFSKVPVSGFLFENISKKEEEKKRQLDAIQKVENGEVQNRELIYYLFNPSKLESQFNAQSELEEIFQQDDNGNPFVYSTNQTTAVLNGINKKPLSVIQGPPGTGKTTVITEIVFQLLDKEPDAKILITSQTNDAVDNVLDNLLKKEIPIVRLSGVRKPKGELRKHTLERKIEGWKKEVKRKAKERWNERKTSFLNDLSNENIVISSIVQTLFNEKSWKIKKNQIEKLLSRVKGITNIDDWSDERSLINSLNSRVRMDLCQFYELNMLHKEWLAAVSSLDDKSPVNQKLIDSIRVLGATTNHIASKKYAKYNFEFDYVIMDESGKATTAESLIPIVMAENLILVGDHRQLRPMLTANKEVERWLKNKLKREQLEDDEDDYLDRPSLFENVIEVIPEDHRAQLEECRRMPKDAVELTSKCFYEPFGDEPLVPVKREQDKEHGLELKVQGSVIFLDIGNGKDFKSDFIGRSSRNKRSAELVPKIIRKLDQFSICSSYKIGVISGYSAQVRELRKLISSDHHRGSWQNLKGISETSVVDKFQGLEKDIIIFDLTRSQQNTLGFLESANRINVALSRHKKLLILIGNYDWVVNVKPRTSPEVQLQKYLKMLPEQSIVQRIEHIF